MRSVPTRIATAAKSSNGFSPENRLGATRNPSITYSSESASAAHPLIQGLEGGKIGLGRPVSLSAVYLNIPDMVYSYCGMDRRIHRRVRSVVARSIRRRTSDCRSLGTASAGMRAHVAVSAQFRREGVRSTTTCGSCEFNIKAGLTASCMLSIHGAWRFCSSAGTRPATTDGMKRTYR